MNAKQMFQEYIALKQYIENIRPEDPVLEALVRRPPADGSSETYQRILAKRRAEITRAKRMKAHIEDTTDLLEPTLRDVLYYRYICSYTAVKTGRLMNYSDRNIRRLEQQAAAAVEKLEERSTFARSLTAAEPDRA